MGVIADELREAKAAKVRLAPGQRVTVRTKGGKDVAKGFITDVNGDLDFVRVRDWMSGADLQVDVDPQHYVVWVDDHKDPGPRLPQEIIMYVRPGLFNFYGRVK